MDTIRVSPYSLQKKELTDWVSVLGNDPAFADPRTSSVDWCRVRVPHNWDDYHGYHAVSHGNLHGTAWYRIVFEEDALDAGARRYAFFEGVGSYATVYLNGEKLGYHAGGRTTFTVDLTDALIEGENHLAVKAEHPEGIDDLPFVCGGCWGSPNSEGSQPFGIFRPVWLESTGPVRVDPFGVHVLTPLVSADLAKVKTRTSLSNPGDETRLVRLRQEVWDEYGNCLAESEAELSLAPFGKRTLEIDIPEWKSPRLWSPEFPEMHRIRSEVYVEDQLSHEVDTSFGLRWLDWPKIVEPEKGALGASSRGALIHDGEQPRTFENNGLSHILHREDESKVVSAPMGIAVRQLEDTNLDRAELSVELSLRGSASAGEEFQVLFEIQNEAGTVFFYQHRVSVPLFEGENSIQWEVPTIRYPRRWSSPDHYLHRLLIEIRSPAGELWERSETLFGIRGLDWNSDLPLNLDRPRYEKIETKAGEEEKRERRLKLNDKPLFLRGTCEYETMLGNDHAFTDDQIEADVSMMLAAGFNAFRDAHHPHNLRYYDHWDRAGIVCWTQMGSHVYFDNERFRENYRQLVREWVVERRNHPCIILWGLQNESTLPKDFAEELNEIIRELDPTSPQWRLTTTCNGGEGSDWNVPQEWKGTYGGNFNDYSIRDCQLVGEYGAWREFGVHTEFSYSGNENDRSETWACAAMEAKIRIGEEMRDEAVGHFHWVYNTFPNPGRAWDNCEGPGNAQIGSVNNKGMVTTWHQPSDLYYLFYANYADPQVRPMVYIVSHTWPDRWKDPQPRTVTVFSNCEEVELFNGVSERSLRRLKHPGVGKRYQWDHVLPVTNLLHAVGYHNGEKVAEDLIRLDHLPEDPGLRRWIGEDGNSSDTPGDCLYRINCGSRKDWVESTGKVWTQDSPWKKGADCGWESWGNRFDNVPDDLASFGDTMTPVRNTRLQEIYRTYRFGREHLKYHFRTGPGRFRFVCHFAEPWFGVGSEKDASRLRLFDVAINDTVVEEGFDVWERAQGHHRAITRTYEIESNLEIQTLHFPYVSVNQAILFGVECYLS
ncbi:glycoside hydrolase family 2 TIM barrel-domain containing protein [Puniceicoccus vermicola]|uniref:DUF4982 domain-containing protein n=1 Tax=Puniceicoccus vermicola TaxID=388746 RepID=A0A7X1E3B5_9BACT|nr:glycoside hydrolase family 2 TIM barrel-domain containing protein [Puniceicoccus vermicola]MBC2600799.1 DUF4982 domain-containing protein [Puniceicoccus vermicola]